MKGAPKQFMKILVVQLDDIERGGDAAVRLGDNQHRGSRHLLRVYLGRFRFNPAHIKRTGFDVAYHKVLVFHGTEAVHKILVHRFFSFIVNNIPTSRPATIPRINTRTGFGGRFSSV